MIGETLSHYKITGEIGAGGMGVVYEAEDLTLRRTVALKFLPPELTRDADARKRFVQEARAASALDHHNICTIHEVGESDGHVFIVMARYQGETLKERIARGPLDVSEALDIASQIAAGVGKAHATGIVHRDIKPGNIFITGDDMVKILDFGLARLAGETRLTKTGTTVGTVMYMSPEQATGKAVDACSDVWSIGAVFYEMLTGRAPFVGEADAAVVYQIVNMDPTPVTSIRAEVPLGVENAVDKALARDPGKRYGNAGELQAAIEAEHDLLKAGLTSGGSVTWKRFRRNRRAVISTSAAAVILIAVVVALILIPNRGATIDSLAVLPLETLSGATMADTILAESVTVELINNFGQLKGLDKVISRTTAMHYRGTDKSPSEIGAELSVKALVAGTIHRTGETVRITAEVLESSTGELLWSDKVEGGERELPRLQDQLTQAIAVGMHVDLYPDEITRLTHTPMVDPDLYNEYVKGVYFLGNDLDKSPTHFQRAIAIDSTYALAWAGLAEYHILTAHTWLPPAGAEEKARECVDRALELDPDLPEALYTHAHIAWEHEWHMQEALDAFDRALALQPSYGYGQLTYAYFCTANRMFEEGATAARKALEQDPLNPIINTTAWFNLACAGYENEAYEVVRKTQELIPEFSDSYARVAIPFTAKDYDGVLNLPEVADSIAQRNARMHQIMVYLELGDTSSAAHLAELYEPPPETDNPMNLAIYYAWAGDHDRAFGYLERVVDAHSMIATRLVWSWYYKPLYGDPRWAKLIKRVGLLVDV